MIGSLLAAGVCSVLAAAGQVPTFRSGTEVVLVDVLVTNGGAPVEGLRAEDFDVRDSGVRQTVERILIDAMPVDLLVALDVSASVAGERLTHLKQAVQAAVDALQPVDRAQLLAFSNRVGIAAGWTSDRDVLRRAIDGLQASGWTSLIDATFTALALPETVGHRPLLLLVTDGRDTSSWLSPLDAIAAAERSRMTVYGVSSTAAMGAAISPRELRERLLSNPMANRAMFLPVLVHDTGGELLHASGRDLSATFVRVLERFRRRYLLSYAPTGVPRRGWHSIEVRVKDPQWSVKARRGYTR